MSIHARGDRSDEVLNLDLSLPLLPPAPAPAAAAAPSALASNGNGMRRLLPALPTNGPAGDGGAVPAGPVVSAVPAELAGPAAARPGLPGGGGRLLLRGGQLLVAGNVDARGSQLDFKARCHPLSSFTPPHGDT